MTQSNRTIGITVHAGNAARQDWPVEVTLDRAQITALSSGDHGETAALCLSEVRGATARAIPCQVDRQNGARATLTFLLDGATAANSTRRFQLAGGVAASDAPALVRITDGVMHQEQESYRIETPNATYLYHKQGAGFASLIDADGHDWLSYRPHGGSDGKYRGIPNLAYPESNFHPGNTESTSRIVAAGPLKATIESETVNGAWACRWDIFPAFARLTVLRVGHPYWFLYEGTPGGQLDEANDYVVRAPGIRTPASARWDGPIPTPRWIYFGAGNVSRALYLVHHNDDGETDSYWPMEGNMTVFGFGRLGLASTLTQVPARFSVGLAQVPDDGDGQILAPIETAIAEMRVEMD